MEAADLAFSPRLGSWPRQLSDSSFRTSLTFSGIVGGNVHATDLHVRWVTRTANHFTFTRETTQLSFRGKQALVVASIGSTSRVHLLFTCLFQNSTFRCLFVVCSRSPRVCLRRRVAARGADLQRKENGQSEAISCC